MVNETDKERIALAQADLAQTNNFIKGVVATGAAIRGSAITIWLALLGFAVQQDLAEFGLLAAIVAAVFFLADGYHGWLLGISSPRCLLLALAISETLHLGSGRCRTAARRSRR